VIVLYSRQSVYHNYIVLTACLVCIDTTDCLFSRFVQYICSEKHVPGVCAIVTA